MKKAIGCLLFILISYASLAQEVEVIKYDALDQMIAEKDGKFKVFNFWATWCRPCVKELPYFEALHKEYKDGNLEVILVSFDFVENLDSKLIPFLQRKNITAKVVLLDETDFNSFVNKVSPSWSGALPATLMVNTNGTKHFYEKEFHEGELKQLVLKHNNKL